MEAEVRVGERCEGAIQLALEMEKGAMHQGERVASGKRRGKDSLPQPLMGA